MSNLDKRWGWAFTWTWAFSRTDSVYENMAISSKNVHVLSFKIAVSRGLKKHLTVLHVPVYLCDVISHSSKTCPCDLRPLCLTVPSILRLARSDANLIFFSRNIPF